MFEAFPEHKTLILEKLANVNEKSEEISKLKLFINNENNNIPSYSDNFSYTWQLTL